MSDDPYGDIAEAWALTRLALGGRTLSLSHRRDGTWLAWATGGLRSANYQGHATAVEALRALAKLANERYGGPYVRVRVDFLSALLALARGNGSDDDLTSAIQRQLDESEK